MLRMDQNRQPRYLQEHPKLRNCAHCGDLAETERITYGPAEGENLCEECASDHAAECYVDGTP